MLLSLWHAYFQEAVTPPTPDPNACYVLTESGDRIILQDGTGFLLRQTCGAVLRVGLPKKFIESRRNAIKEAERRLAQERLRKQQELERIQLLKKREKERLQKLITINLPIEDIIDKQERERARLKKLEQQEEEAILEWLLLDD